MICMQPLVEDISAPLVEYAGKVSCFFSLAVFIFYQWQLVPCDAIRRLTMMNHWTDHGLSFVFMWLLHTKNIFFYSGFTLQVYCSSSSFFMEKPDIQSSSVESKEFFAGIKVTLYKT